VLSGAAASGQSIFPLGVVAGFSLPLTIPNVTIPANTLLVILAGCSNDTSETFETTVTWGATPVPGTNPQSNNDGTIHTTVHLLRVLVGATQTLTINNPAPGLDILFALASYLIGPAADVGGSGTSVGLAGSPTDAPINVAPANMAAVWAWARNAISDPGPWLAPVIAGQGIAIGGAFAPGWIAEGFLPTGLSGIIHAKKTLTPPAIWFTPWEVLV
jgi:hypothetical protein